MTFLNPIVLVGLAAAAIPILIHLLNLRKLRTIEFSSLAFLKDLQRSSIRRLKLRQLLLMILRTLLVLAIVLAFARPTLRGSMMGMAPGQATSAMVILLDDSPSMTLGNQRGMLFAQAKEAARTVARQAGEGDRIILLPLSTLQSQEERPAEGRQAIERILPDLRTTEITVPYAEALKHARALLEDAPEAQREIYLLTDGQATQFAGDSARTPEDPRLGVFVLSLEPSRRENLGAGAAELRSQILAPGRSVEVACSVSNYGEAVAPQVVASLYFDRTRVAQQSATIAGRASHSVTLKAIARGAGQVAGTVQLDDDQLSVDNTSYFAFTVPARLSILLAGPAGPQRRLPELALTLGGDTTIAARFEVTAIPDERIPFAQFSQYDAVVLSGVARFAEAEAARLASYVRDGGGVVIFPGPSTDLENFNRVLLHRLGFPGATLRDISGTDGTGGTFLSFASVDVDHPLFAGMFEQERGARVQGELPMESPHIRRAVAPTGAGHRIITLAGGVPFLTEYRLGAGKVMVFAVDAGAAWSDFPFKGIYAPLLHQMMLYLSARTAAPERYTTGTPLELALRASSSPEAIYLLRSPAGAEERLVPSGSASGGMIRLRASAPAETGFYHLMRQIGGREEELLIVPVNLPERESDLAPAPEDAVREFLARAGVAPERIRWITRPEDLEQSITEARFGVDLWKPFLVLALVLALAEMLVGRERRSREGLS